jgi:hypothetical protein
LTFTPNAVLTALTSLRLTRANATLRWGVMAELHGVRGAVSGRAPTGASALRRRFTSVPAVRAVRPSSAGNDSMRRVCDQRA